MAGIIRRQTEEEKKDFKNIGYKNRDTAESKFQAELNKQEKKAVKAGLPFAAQIARYEWDDHYQEQAKQCMRKFTYIKPEEIKVLKLDWEKYSDLKNFEIVDKGEKVDDFLTKTNPGLTVQAKFTTYKFKGYSNTYRVMESGPDAIARAEEVRAKRVKELDKVK